MCLGDGWPCLAAFSKRDLSERENPDFVKYIRHAYPAPTRNGVNGDITHLGPGHVVFVYSMVVLCLYDSLSAFSASFSRVTLPAHEAVTLPLELLWPAWPVVT